MGGKKKLNESVSPPFPSHNFQHEEKLSGRREAPIVYLCTRDLNLACQKRNLRHAKLKSALHCVATDHRC